MTHGKKKGPPPPTKATWPHNNQQKEEIIVHYMDHNRVEEDQCAFTPVTAEARIGSLSIQPLLDTGSGMSLIPVSTLWQLQSAGTRCTLHDYRGAPLHSAGGDKLTVFRQVMLQITMGSHTHGVDFIVVSSCPVSMILGTKDLCLFNTMLNLVDGLLIMGDKHISISMTCQEIDTSA